MGDIDDRIKQAVENTRILRPPKRSLSTFGTTNVQYYLVTEAIYTEFVGVTETVVREGRVIAEKPRIVTPLYLSRLEGFSTEARHYFETLIQTYGPRAPGLYYSYRNENQGMNIVSDDVPAVIDRLNADLDRRGDPLVSIIRGEDNLWDVSLLKFVYEMTRSSLPDNLMQLGHRGLLDVDAQGLPGDARTRIEVLFQKVQAGDADPEQLRDELERWDVFSEYEDRFLNIFRRRR
jgi:hypothetical protein